MQNKNQRTETSLAIYLIIGAVAALIASVIYFDGPHFASLLGYFVLLALVSLFYNYRVCIFTATISILSYGSVLTYLILSLSYRPDPLELGVELVYFLSMTAIITWLVFKIQNRPPIDAGMPLINQKTRLVLNHLVSGVIVLNKKNEILLLNRQAEIILGIKERQVLDKQDDLSRPAYKNLYKVLTADTELEPFSTTEIKVKTPEPKILQVSTAPLKEGKKFLGIIKILRDITHEKEVDRMKTELISIVSHQLRTPLSAVKWSVKMLLDGDVGKISAEQTNILAKGYRSNERMIHLVNDLLNVSRIEEGRFQYKFVVASLEDLVDQTVNEFKYTLEEKNMNLKISKPAKALPLVRMDPSKIHVVLQNILNNAINYTPSNGSVKISIQPKKTEIITSIKDNGMGIPPRQQASLFTKFFRADNAVRVQIEGSGLGLFIAQNIIEKHKGKIWAESKEGKGSTFYFSLPLA